jgi:diguanylate cyclase (GGDEF)-like protein
MVVFFGMFKLRWMGQILLTAYGMALMAGVMAVMSALRPDVFDPSVELVHFVLLAAVLPSVAVLGAQLTSMRIKLKTQKAELQQALAHNTQLANHDALTGLCNRRYMEECIQRQQKMNQRTGHASTLAMLDLDHFKQINDAHGHRVGDDVLCVFARHLRFALRETDLMARWGGEEFLLMLPNTQPEEAAVVLGRIRDALARLPSPSNQHALHIRFSAGVTALPSYEPLESALDRADRALYRAKDLGRNQSVLI